MSEATVYPTYTYVKTIGASGTEPGNFTLPRQMCIDANGYIYVADDAGVGNGHIEVFNHAGVWIRNIT
ncbi:MAG: hypothetical protein ACXACA_01835, partial [Candidatus Ranarchaeia archaeon]